MGNFVEDTFSGESSVVDLTEHTGETGASWAVVSGYASPRVDNAASNIESHATLMSGAYASGVPASAEYDIQANLGAATNEYPGVIGRVSTSAVTFYHVRKSATDAWDLYKFVSGSVTLLASWQGTYRDNAVKLELRDAAKKVYIDGTERISSSDNVITDTGRAGVRFYSGGSNSRIDNFVATDATISASGSPKIKRLGGIPYIAINRGVW